VSDEPAKRAYEVFLTHIKARGLAVLGPGEDDNGNGPHWADMHWERKDAWRAAVDAADESGPLREQVARLEAELAEAKAHTLKLAKLLRELVALDALSPRRLIITREIPCSIRCWRAGVAVSVKPGEKCPECGSVEP
jgi:hypothetical protein